MIICFKLCVIPAAVLLRCRRRHHIRVHIPHTLSSFFLNHVLFSHSHLTPRPLLSPFAAIRRLQFICSLFRCERCELRVTTTTAATMLFSQKCFFTILLFIQMATTKMCTADRLLNVKWRARSSPTSQPDNKIVKKYFCFVDKMKSLLARAPFVFETGNSDNKLKMNAYIRWKKMRGDGRHGT